MNSRTARTFDGIDYASGSQFQVTKPGLSLNGCRPSGYPGASDGWSQKLQPGDIITCTGYGTGMGGDPGYGVEFESEASEAVNAFHCHIYPMYGDVFSYRPPPGALTPVAQPAAEQDLR